MGCSGSSSEEKSAYAGQAALSQQQAQFYQTLQDSYQKQFAGQSAILDALKTAWSPILAAGPGQKGFTTEQETALRTQATEGTASEYAKAATATKEGMAARGGGTVSLPS